MTRKFLNVFDKGHDLALDQSKRKDRVIPAPVGIVLIREAQEGIRYARRPEARIR
jgi:hypothetical protein